MKKLLLPFSALFLCMLCSAQTDTTFILKSIQTVGETESTQQAIRGTVFVFDGKIRQAKAYPQEQAITVLLDYSTQFRGKGTLLTFNPAAGKTIWEKPVHINRETPYLEENEIFIKRNRQNCCLNISRGDTLWQSNLNIFYTLADKNIGLGYPEQVLSVSNKLHAIDMQKGNTLWITPVKHSSGISELSFLKDSSLFIVADDIYKLNLKNGKGWHYTAITYAEAKTPGMLKYAPESDLDENMYHSLADRNKIYGLVSNPIFKEGLIYVATANALLCLDEQGKKIWKTGLPENETGKSLLFQDGDKLILLNTGYAYYDSRRVLYGSPYLAAFNLHTGKQLYRKAIKKTYVTDGIFRNHQILMLTNEKLVIADANDGTIIREVNIQLPANHQVVSFVSKPYYREDAGKYRKIVLTDAQYPLVSDQNTLLLMKPDGSTTVVPAGDLYLETLQKDHYTLISQAKRSVLLTPDQQPLARLQTGNQCFLTGSLLYAIRDNQIVCVDLQSIISNK